jgi:hypothetical protein
VIQRYEDDDRYDDDFETDDETVIGLTTAQDEDYVEISAYPDGGFNIRVLQTAVAWDLSDVFDENDVDLHTLSSEMQALIGVQLDAIG